MSPIVIAGAGVTGTAAALSLRQRDPGLDVIVIEPDYTYRWAATGKGTGGVRQLFTRPENIALSQVTLDVIDDWQQWAVVDGEPAPELGWRQNGYLFIAGTSDLPALEANYHRQLASGVAVEWFDSAALAERYPELNTTDIAAGVLSSRDGWLRPKVLFDVLRAKAAAAGVEFRQDRVQRVLTSGRTVTGVELASGEQLACAALIDAAGVHAPVLAAQVGIDLPVEPMRRHEHYIETSRDISHLPFVKDVHGLAVHPHREGISVGLVDFDHPGGETFDIDADDYPGRVLPALTHRYADIGQLTLRDSWTGLYDQNRFDGNMIIGRHRPAAENFYFACGFSGHGFMHAFGVGRALTELIVDGEYRTIDLRRMEYERILTGERYGEEGVR